MLERSDIDHIVAEHGQVSARPPRLEPLTQNGASSLLMHVMH